MLLHNCHFEQKAYATVTPVALHKIVTKQPSGEVGNSIVVSLQIHLCILALKTVETRLSILPDCFGATWRGILRSSNSRGQNLTTNVGLDGPTNDITGLDMHRTNK